MLRVFAISLFSLALGACSAHPVRVHCNGRLERINPILPAPPAATEKETPAQEPKP